MNEIEIELRGRVQGVNFRYMCKRVVDKLGLKGYVLNREEGSVKIVVQGKSKDIKMLLSWIGTNPGFARIDGVSYNWQKPSIRYNEFRVVKEKNYMLDKARSILNLGKFLMEGRNRQIPLHISIIPDGNRRWAKEKGLIGSLGHYKAGAYDNLEKLFAEAKKIGVKYVSIWGFSTENWKRDKKEIDAIFDLILKGVEKFRIDSVKNKIRFLHMGRKDRLPGRLRNELKELEEETKNYNDFTVVLCLDYGGRDEIIRAVNKIIRKGVKDVDEKTFASFLDSKNIPDPDLIIRTSGEFRTSGLMPYQSGYAELYFTDVYFPDFDEKELRKAIEEYARRQRRFGGS